jgi:hypothetical protein
MFVNVSFTGMVFSVKHISSYYKNNPVFVKNKFKFFTAAHEVKLTSVICFKKKFCKFWPQYQRSISDQIRNDIFCISCRCRTSKGRYAEDPLLNSVEGDEIIYPRISFFPPHSPF